MIVCVCIICVCVYVCVCVNFKHDHTMDTNELSKSSVKKAGLNVFYLYKL